VVGGLVIECGERFGFRKNEKAGDVPALSWTILTAGRNGQRELNGKPWAQGPDDQSKLAIPRVLRILGCPPLPMKTTAAMTPRDWFTLALRILGIWELIYTIDTVVTIFNVTAHLFRLERTDVAAYVTHALISFLIAVWLLKAGPSIAAFFYPQQPLEPLLTGHRAESAEAEHSNPPLSPEG
jgi:hypothetical protein